MTEIHDYLAQVRARHLSALAGPWMVSKSKSEDERLTSFRVISSAGSAVAVTGYGPDGGGAHIDAEFIALARTALPALAAAVEAVMEMHRPISVLAHEDECENPDEEHRENRHHEYADEAGEFYCEDLFQYAVCVGCKDSPYVNWFDDWPEYPCPTRRALTEAMKGSDNE